MNHNSFILKAANYLWLHLWEYKAYERQHKRYVKAISGRTPINVVFMAIDVALWRYQQVYEMMAADNLDAVLEGNHCLLAFVGD